MPLGRGNLPAIVEEVEHAHPLFVGQVMFAREVVQVIDEPVQQLFETAAGLGLECLLHRLCNCELIDITH